MSDEDVWVQLSVALNEVERLWGVLERVAEHEHSGFARDALAESRRNLVDRLDYGTKT